ncbi:hypothetical protein BGX27_008951 [Mortierella sp. AM989]|nr:hypothetical protein BGX27_008951 [Mortierella sp. AM989]
MVTFDEASNSSGTPGACRPDLWGKGNLSQLQHNYEFPSQHHDEQLFESQKSPNADFATSRSSLPSPQFPPDPSISFEQSIKLQLLEHPSIQKEMQLVTRNRIRLQQRPSSKGSSGQVGATAPCLFVILPTVTEENQSRGQSLSQSLYHHDQSMPSQDDFRLHFLCDFGDYEHVSKQQDDHHMAGHFVPSYSTPAFTTPYPPQLHVCDEDNGYDLNDLDDFCQIHKMTLLSLLRNLQSSLSQISQHDYEISKRQKHETPTMDQEMSSPDAIQQPLSPLSPSLSLLRKRIEAAIKYMLHFFTMADLECIIQSPSDMDIEDYNDEFMPSLRTQDFAVSNIERIMRTTTSDGRILGPLAQRNTRAAARNLNNNNARIASTPIATGAGVGLVQWLCSHHAQMHCKTQAREHLKDMVAKNGGSCAEQERSVEIQFQSRERAAEFYKLILEYQCIIKLKIQIGWEDLNESDLWNLAEAVNESNIGDLTLDCCYDSEGGGGNMLETNEHHRTMNLPFKPILGMLFSPNLASFSLENFSGSLPLLSSSNFNCSLDSFTLQRFRQSNPAEYNLPAFSNLRSLIFNRCGQDLKAGRLIELIRHSPYLTELHLECDNLDTSIEAIKEATNQMDNVTYLKLSESPWEGIDITYAKAGSAGGEGRGSVLQSVTRKTRRTLDLDPQYAGALEHLATCAYMNLWEQHQTTLSNLFAQNPRLHRIELMCEARSMDMLWRFLTSHYHHNLQVYQQQQQLSQMNIHQSQSSSMSLSASSATSLRLRLYDTSCSLLSIIDGQNNFLLHSYTPQHRRLLQSLEDITNGISIGSTFDCPEQLALLQSHAEQDGGLRFDNLTWVPTPKTQNDASFMQQLRALISCNPQIKTYTIRVYAMLFDIQTLICTWNWIIGAAYLNEEHARWMQACFEDSCDAPYNQLSPTAAAAAAAAAKLPSRHKPTDAADTTMDRQPGMQVKSSVRHIPDHGIMQSYTLHLDEDKDLILASSHFYFSSLLPSSVNGARTALAYTLTLAQRD